MAATDALELPIGVTESKVLQQIARIESQLRKVQNNATANFVKANQKVAQSFGGVSQAASGMSRQTVASLQNVSYQIQDIFVQIQGGQGAMRAFSQQMPQLLSGFGFAGAAAGLAVAVGSSLIPMLIDTGEESLTTKEALDGLTASLDNYIQFLEVAGSSTEDLREKFGDFAGVIREMSEGMAQVTLGKVFDSVGTAIEPIKGGLVEVANATRQVIEAEQFLATIRAQTSDPEMIYSATAALELYQAELYDAANAMGLSVQQAQALNAAIDRFSAARASGEVSQLRDAANAARLEIEQMVNGDLMNAPPAVREIYEAMGGVVSKTAEAAEKQREMNDWFNQIKNTAADLWAGNPGSGWLAGEISDALQLAKAFWAAAQAKAAALTEASAQTTGNTAWYWGQTAEDLLPPKRGLAPSRVKKSKGDGGRKGGGRSSEKTDPLEDTQKQTQLLIEQAAAFDRLTTSGLGWENALEAMEMTQKLVNDAQRAGIEVTPEYQAKVEAAVNAYIEAKTRMDEMKDATKRGEDAMNDLFGAMLDGADSAKQAIANLLKEIAKIQLQKGLMGLLGLGGGGGLLSGIGGLLTPNANGGVYGGAGISAYSGKVVSSPTVFPFAKGIGLMGEAGPEAIMPLTRINGKLGVRAEGGGVKSGGAVDVRVYMDEGGNWQAKVEQISGKVAAQTVGANSRASADKRYLSGGR